MYAPEAESDEDNEVYFLRPVNEYNMVDKIKEANKQLFGDDNVGAADDADEADRSAHADEAEPLLGNGDGQKIKVISSSNGNNNNDNNSSNSSVSRKVTFALNLENYEPIGKDTTETEDAEDDDTDEHAGDAVPGAPGDEPNNNNHKLLNKKKFRCGIIPEETETEINEATAAANNRNAKEVSACQITAIADTAPLIEVPLNDNAVAVPLTASNNNNNKSRDDEQIIDEICEEIILMDIEHDEKNTKACGTNSTTTLQRRNTIIKQATFDYDEQDNKSMTNLLNDSNDEDDEYRPLFTVGNDGQDASNDDNQHDDLDDLITYYDTDDDEHINNAGVQHGIKEQLDKVADVEDGNGGGGDDDGGDDDDDDDLSLIVASYLPHDFEYAALTQPRQQKIQIIGAAAANGPPKKRSYFSKRFSFRRKVNSNNAIGTTCRHFGKNLSSPSRSGRAAAAAAAAGLTDYELNDLKLNYKTCCEYRYALMDKLPRYTGYLSEYGLSQEQLEDRAQKLKHKKHSAMEQTLRTKEHELRKMQDNERAFTTWLKNKMRFPINKTRNMFDVKTKQRTANNGINKLK